MNTSIRSRLLKAAAGLEVTDEFERAIEAIELAGDNVFITGRAGTGKSTLLTLFRAITDKQIAVVAPTGAAAINVGGQTLHSFFRFPPHPPSQFDIRKSDNAELYRSLDALVIDEVSMVRADLMDAIDKFLRINRGKKSRPFGGVQMIMIGDLFQLPPVVKTESEVRHIELYHGTPHFFGSTALQAAGMQTIELKRIYRQQDLAFVEALNAIRSGRVSDGHLALLNSRVEDTFDFGADDPAVLLTPTNRVASRVNGQRLGQISGAHTVFEAQVTEKFGHVPENQRPAPTRLQVKVGAHVMFIRNDRDRRWVNGTMGRVAEIEEDSIRVVITDDDSDGASHWVNMETWEMYEYAVGEEKSELEMEVVGTFTQFPLRLGYAITIHKGQGKTLDHAIVDMGRGAFAPGQTYVALSRVRSLDGLVLTRPISRDDVKVDRDVVAFLEEGIVPSAVQRRLF